MLGRVVGRLWAGYMAEVVSRQGAATVIRAERGSQQLAGILGLRSMLYHWWVASMSRLVISWRLRTQDTGRRTQNESALKGAPCRMQDERAESLLVHTPASQGELSGALQQAINEKEAIKNVLRALRWEAGIQCLKAFFATTVVRRPLATVIEWRIAARECRPRPCRMQPHLVKIGLQKVGRAARG